MNKSHIVGILCLSVFVSIALIYSYSSSAVSIRPHINSLIQKLGGLKVPAQPTEETEYDVPLENMMVTAKNVSLENKMVTAKNVPLENKTVTAKNVPLENKMVTAKNVPLENKTVTAKNVPLKKKMVTVINVPSWMPKHLVKMDYGGCEVKTCTLTYVDGLKHINESDAVVLYAVGFGYYRRDQLFRKYKQGQVWIFATWESPHHSYMQNFNKPILHNQINWTMTYRLDSDIPVLYSIVSKKTNLNPKNYTQILAKKTKMIAWVVSNCYTPSRRREYVDQLRTRIPVDIYGRCGPTRVENNDVNLFPNIEKTYKFYLSFENSLCLDYVTEKLFIWQNKSIVPIVRGSANYSHYYPKNSYIDVNDFKSADELANHLLYLDKNNTAYVEYLKAKENYVASENYDAFYGGFCDICKMLHEPGKHQNLYRNVYDWYTNGTCTSIG